MPPAPVIGLEVHVQLATGTKLFCRCPSEPTQEVNRRVCPVCAGLPGALPVLDHLAVDYALRVASSLGSQIAPHSNFDRKNYFYPDLPKGFQITQQSAPLATGGRLPLLHHDGAAVPIRQLHLEEDAGRQVALPGDRLGLSFERAGVALLEVVTEPTLRSAEEAQDALKTLQALVRCLGVSHAALDQGELRCDVNLSLPLEDGTPGVRTEIKNLNSFRFVARAIEAEIGRRRALQARDELVREVTLGYDESDDRVYVQRAKEAAWDYRFHREPDLPAVQVDSETLDRITSERPELPWERHERLASLGVPPATARVFARDGDLARYLDAVEADREVGPSWRDTAAWISGEVVSQTRLHGEDAPLPSADRLARLLDLVQLGDLSRGAAKSVLPLLWESEKDPEALARGLGLLQVADQEKLDGWIAEVLNENPLLVDRYRAGKHQILGFLVGQVMAHSGGSAAPQKARELLLARLQEEAPS